MRKQLLVSLEVSFDLLFLLTAFKPRSFKFHVYNLSNAVCMTTNGNKISIRIWGLKRSTWLSGFLAEDNSKRPISTLVDDWLSTEDAAFLINSELTKKEINEQNH